MKESFKNFINSLEYKSLVLMHQACNNFKENGNLEFEEVEELLIHFMREEELEQDVKYNNILERIPANGEDFAYSVRNFKTEYLWDLIEFFEYAYVVTKKEEYKRTSECLNIVLKYRKEMIDLTFSKCESMSVKDINFYISLIPKDIIDKMADYMQVPSRNKIEEYQKVKCLGRV